MYSQGRHYKMEKKNNTAQSFFQVAAILTKIVCAVEVCTVYWKGTKICTCSWSTSHMACSYGVKLTFFQSSVINRRFISSYTRVRSPFRCKKKGRQPLLLCLSLSILRDDGTRVLLGKKSALGKSSNSGTHHLSQEKNLNALSSLSSYPRKARKKKLSSESIVQSVLS